MTSIDHNTLTRCELEEERAHLRSLRRVLTSGCALFGIFPFARAVAPGLVPWLVEALSAIWAAMLVTLGAIGIQELLLWRSRRRMRRTPPSSVSDAK